MNGKLNLSYADGGSGIRRVRGPGAARRDAGFGGGAYRRFGLINDSFGAGFRTITEAGFRTSYTENSRSPIRREYKRHLPIKSPNLHSCRACVRYRFAEQGNRGDSSGLTVMCNTGIMPSGVRGAPGSTSTSVQIVNTAWHMRSVRFDALLRCRLHLCFTLQASFALSLVTACGHTRPKGQLCLSKLMMWKHSTGRCSCTLGSAWLWLMRRAESCGRAQASFIIFRER